MKDFDKFVSEALHKLKSPITVAREGVMIVLDETAGSVNDEQKDFLLTARKSIDRLACMLVDVFEYQKLFDSNCLLKKEICDLPELIKNVIKSDLLGFASKRNVEIEFDCVADCSSLCCDKSKMALVFRKLIANAVQFSCDSSSVKVIVDSFDNNLIVKVFDNAVVIEKEKYNDIFEPFFKSTHADNLVEGGAGMGLAIVKKILQLHSASIVVAGIPSQGNVFTVTLPLPINEE